MEFYLVNPAVYGYLGQKAIISNDSHPPKIVLLDIVLDSQPKDDLHTVFPCYLVSSRLGRQIQEIGLTGVSFGDAHANMDEQYAELHPDEKAPDILWLKIFGTAQADDFGLNPDGSLVVSEVALGTLRAFRLNDCRVYIVKNSPSSEKILEDTWAEARKVAEALRQSRKTPEPR